MKNGLGRGGRNRKRTLKISEIWGNSSWRAKKGKGRRGGQKTEKSGKCPLKSVHQKGDPSKETCRSRRRGGGIETPKEKDKTSGLYRATAGGGHRTGLLSSHQKNGHNYSPIMKKKRLLRKPGVNALGAFDVN